MITLTYQNLNHPHFEKALNKLENAIGLQVKTAYQIAKISECLRKELMHARKLYEQLMIKYNMKDEQSKQENQELFLKEFNEFLALQFSLNNSRILVSQLEAAKLTPAEILAIDPMVYELEEVK